MSVQSTRTRMIQSRSRHLLLAAVAAIGLSTVSARATSYTWDTNNIPTDQEDNLPASAGSWDLTNPNWWNNDSNGPTDGLWVNDSTTASANSAFASPVNGSTNGRLTVADNTTIEINSFTIKGAGSGNGVFSTGSGNLHFTGTTPTISLTTSSATLGAKLTGNAITFNLGSTLTINNSNSTFDGAIYNSGTSTMIVSANSVGGPNAVTSGPLGAGTVTLGGKVIFDTSNGNNLVLDNPLSLSSSSSSITIGQSATTTARTITFGGDVTFTGATFFKINTSGSTNNNNITVDKQGLLTFSGTLSGSVGTSSNDGLRFSNSTPVLISGTANNTYAGKTYVLKNSPVELGKTAGRNAIPSGGVELGTGTGTGTLRLMASNQIADDAGVAFQATTSGGNTSDAESFDLNGFDEIIGTLGTSFTTTSNAAFKYLVTNNGAADTTSTLTVKRTAGDAYFNGLIVDGTNGGKVALSKDGGGTLNLGNTNTYTGATNVLAGTLALTHINSVNNYPDGSISNSSSINIASGATFDVSGLPSAYAIPAGQVIAGEGNVHGSIQVAGTLSPGTAGVGTLTMDGTGLSLADGAVYDFDISGTTASPLSDLMDLVNGSSTVTLGGSYTLNVSNLSAGALDPTGKTFDLIHYLGDDPGSVGTWTINLPAGWEGTPMVTLDTANKAVVLSGLTSVPEPATTSLICLGAAGLLLRRARPRVA